MNTKPLVTVVIPCHNKAETIIRAIDSIKTQSLNNLECFVILDNCTDDSVALAKEACATDRRFNYFEIDFGNVADSRNYGIAQGDAPFICCLDGDDWIEPEFLERCTKPLLDDRSLGITFTGLMSRYKDGHKIQSPWTDGFDYDRQITKRGKNDHRGHNQVPTCCIFRRVAWERVGGYKSRYCGDKGAGAEDAALWTAIGSIGFNARQVTRKSLFNYSMEGGLVHGNKQYKEPEWLRMYPWVEDGLHPFASIARPKNHSHPVRQYDQPKVSVIIPVGPGHEKEVRNALDSLEMQHFRQWEAIVVWDCIDPDVVEKNMEDMRLVPFQRFMMAYPYVKNIITPMGKGAGLARNWGIKQARSPLILFLDADDIFNDAEALDKMIKAWNQERAIIYSDYLGKASWNYDTAIKEFGPMGTGRLLGWLNKTQQAIIRHYAADYDCNLAQKQPQHDHNNPKMPYFHWALVSCLMPKVWHEAIGGFDESMETWEDVDYHWRLARAGYCFHRIEEPLFLYNYDGGHRRTSSSVTDKDSRQKHQKMIEYLIDKYKGIEIVMCNCDQNTKEGQFVNSTGAMSGGAGAANDDDMILIEFAPNYTGNRALIGAGYKNPNGKAIDYGYGRRRGDRFYVHRLDIQAQSHLFRIVSEGPHVEVIEQPKRELSPPEPLEPEYTSIEPEMEIQMIEGMYGNYTARQMIETVEDQENVLDEATLKQLLQWETENKNRKTVVKAINKNLKLKTGIREKAQQET